MTIELHECVDYAARKDIAVIETTLEVIEARVEERHEANLAASKTLSDRVTALIGAVIGAIVTGAVAHWWK